jgi:hypothetical protein
MIDDRTRTPISHMLINPRPHLALMTAANLLGMPFPMLKREVAEGTIVAVSVGAVESEG